MITGGAGNVSSKLIIFSTRVWVIYKFVPHRYFKTIRLQIYLFFLFKRIFQFVEKMRQWNFAEFYTQKKRWQMVNKLKKLSIIK